MPTYEYACTSCGHRMEAVQSFSDPALTTCPVCHGALRKVFGNVGIVLKGSGFYKNDSRSSGRSNGSAPKEASKETESSSSSDSASKDSSSSSDSASKDSSSGKEASKPSSSSSDSSSKTPAPAK
jgi:putative FmdB family regulatory protein